MTPLYDYQITTYWMGETTPVCIECGVYRDGIVYIMLCELTTLGM